MSLSLPAAIGPAAVDSDAPYFEVTWTDPVTGAKGYLVLDRLVRGASAAAGCGCGQGRSLSEVRGLARGMTPEGGDPLRGRRAVCAARRRQGRDRLRSLPHIRRRNRFCSAISVP